MKNIAYTFLFLSGLFMSCKEETLTPSNLEHDRIAQLIDLSKPLVKEYKENYDVSILYNFDDVLDLKFNMYSTNQAALWNGMEVIHIAPGDEDWVLSKLNDMVLSNFKKEYFKAKLPHKILIADRVSYKSMGQTPDAIVKECSYKEEGYGTAFGNEYIYMFAFNKEQIDLYESNPTPTNRANKSRLIGVKMYGLICYTIEKHNLYKEIPNDFFSIVEHLHNQELDYIASQEKVPPIIPGTSTSKFYEPTWFINLGMAITENFPTLDASTYEKSLPVGKGAKFADRKRDFRNFLNVVFCEIANDDLKNIETYYLNSERFRKRMVIVLDLLEKWGIDYEKVNPQLKEFYKN